MKYRQGENSSGLFTDGRRVDYKEEDMSERLSEISGTERREGFSDRGVLGWSRREVQWLGIEVRLR